jgi:hypothetical protein
MHAVLITLTPGRLTEFIDCQKGKVRITGMSDYGCEDTLELNTGVG